MSPFIQFEIVLVLAITPNLQLKSEHFVSMLWDSISYLNFLIYLAVSDTVLLGNGAGSHPLTTQSRWKCRFSTHCWYLRGLVTLEKGLETRLPASLHWDQDDSGGVASLLQDGGKRPPLTQARRARRVVAYYCKKIQAPHVVLTWHHEDGGFCYCMAEMKVLATTWPFLTPPGWASWDASL